MTSAGAQRGWRRVAVALLGPAGLMAVSVPSAQPAPNASGIYTCVDAKGRRHTSDRPIPECLDREQTIRNRDGSQRGSLPPSYTAEERAQREEQRRRAEAAEAARQDRQRRDRNLLARYPDEAAHRRARAVALEPILRAEGSNRQRLKELERERAKLAEEAEFYPGGELPRALRLRMESNRAALDAQQAATAEHLAERRRIDARYDEELLRLRQLWAERAAALGSAGRP